MRVIGSIIDITERKRAVNALEESEEKFSVAFYSSGAALAISKLDDGTILEANDCFLDIFGYTHDEVIGKTAEALNLYADNSERKKIIALTLNEKPVFNREVKGKKKDNTEITVLLTTKVFAIKGQKHLLTTLIDISNLRKTEKALFLRQNELENFFALAPDAVIVGDLTGKIIECNELSSKTFGLTKEEIIGVNGLDFISESKREQIAKEFARIIKNKQVQTSTFKSKSKEGKEINVEASVKAIYDNQDNPTGFIAIIRDITERNIVERKLHESEERYRFMAQNAQDIISVTDLKGNFNFISPSIKRISGFDADELVGKRNVFECIHEDDVPRLNSLIQEIIDNNVAKQFEFRFLAKNNRYIWFEANINPIKNTFGENRFISISRDITQRRIDHEERDKALAKAELLLEKLSVVGGFVRHDVRNKLATVSGTLYLCKKHVNTNDNELMLNHLEQIDYAVKNIEHILEFAQTYEAAGSKGLSWYSINNAVEEAKSLFLNLTNAQIIHQKVDFEVLADSALVEIFHNLIDNSNKYGKNLTEIRIFSRKNDKGNVELIYEDNGGGIDPEIRPRLFKKGAGKGTGLGLYLIQRICDIYGWQVTERDKQGNGVSFVMEIPKERIRKINAP